MFVRTTNEQADIFHFNEGFLRGTLCSSHQDQQAWRTGEGGVWSPWKAHWGDLVSDPEELFMEPKELCQQSRSHRTDCDS